MLQDIAPHQFDNQFVAGRLPQADSPIYCFREDQLLLAQDREEDMALPSYQDFAKANLLDELELVRLFAVDQKEYFLARSKAREGQINRILSEAQIYGRREDPEQEEGFLLLEGFGYYSLRQLRREKRGEKYQYFSAMVAYQLARWYDNNRFCGHCGHRMIRGEKERVLLCPRCKNHIYPKILPAVIVGVTNGDRLLMTQYRGRGVGYYALVAGFVEIGESFEDTVRREVMEETGLRVKNIRYYKSQPWGIVDDLLAGFFCDVDGSDQIRMDQDELKMAAWFEREQIEGQPDHLSLTNEMMLAFRAGREK